MYDSKGIYAVNVTILQSLSPCISVAIAYTMDLQEKRLIVR